MGSVWLWTPLSPAPPRMLGTKNFSSMGCMQIVFSSEGSGNTQTGLPTSGQSGALGSRGGGVGVWGGVSSRTMC